MYSRKFLFIVPVLIAFIALSLLFLSLDPPALAHTVTVNANPADWPMAAPGQVNLGHIGRNATHQGEYIWRDNPNDQRTDWGGNEQADLLEFRVTADSANLYFMAVMSDITQLGGNGVPQIQVAIDTDRVSGSGEPWLGSLSDTQVSPNAEWEYLLITRFGSGYSNLVVWQNGYVTQIFTGTAAISDTINTIEFSVPWAALEMSAPPTLPLRLTVATFRANASDETWDSSGNSDAVDAITNYGDPGSTANTWSEVSDGVVNYYFDLFFEPDGDVYPPLLVSEVLYDPDGTTENDEFIEIINISPIAIDLDGYKVGDEETIDQTGAPQDSMGAFPAGYQIPFGGVIVVARNSTAFLATFGFLPDFEFTSQRPDVPDMILYSNWDSDPLSSVTLGNTGDEVLLLDGSDTVIDVVTYEAGSWPGVSNNITVGNGQSMERAPANWDTNDIARDFVVRPNNGTPGRRSSFVVGVSPAVNAVAAPPTATLTITSHQAISATAVSSLTLAVHGMQSGLAEAAYGVSGNTIFVTPTRPFHQGELIYAVVTTRTLQDAPIAPTWGYQWQFNAGAVFSRCVDGFADIAAGLPGVYNSSAAWGDYDRDGDLDILLTGYDGSARIARVYRNDGGVFTDIGAGLPGVYNSSAAWGDYDNDGDLDILLTGWAGSAPIARVYRNDGGVFTDIGAGLHGVYNSSAAWGDYDNDGDLDILLAGDTGSGYIARVYRNNGGVFTDIAANLPGVHSGSAAWGDYDGDGDMDILLTGYDGSGYIYIARVYRNNGDGTFTDIGAGLPGVYRSSVAWGDYDGDGDLDILLTGDTGSGPIARVYRNDGGTFTDIGAGLPGVYVGSAAWGDYDNDGDLDILLTGYDGSARITRVYRNDGGVFTDIGAGLPGVTSGSVAWGDYDGDGDLDILLTGWADSGPIARVYRNDDCADLAVVKYADPEPGVAGESITYTIVISNIGAGIATGVTLTDTLHPSTTLQTMDQRDDDAADFALGTHTNTRWNDDRPQYDEWLEQINPALLGNYTSRVFDAGQDGAIWDTLSWLPRRPYGKPLPDNNGAEWGYDDGNVDMWGNRLLLHLDEPGAPFADSSGSGLTVTCGGDCPQSGSGWFTQGAFFDGVDDVLVISDTHSPARYAVELWVYPTAVTTSSMILRTDTLSGTAYHYSHMLGIVGDKFFHMVNDGQERWAIGTTTVQPNTWYHVVGTAESGGDLRLYVNGVEEAHVADLGALWAGGDEYRLGSSYGLTGTGFYAGHIDEVAVYTRTLASSEVLAHYVRGAQQVWFEVRSCAQPDCSDGAWVGAYYSEQTNTSLTTPWVNISAPANRYFQYRATLGTDQPDYRPQIEWVQVAPAHYVIVTTQGSYTTAVDGKAFTCTLGTLAPGEAVTVTAWVDIARDFTGTITNTVWVTAAGDISVTNNTAQVTSTVESHVGIRVYKYDEYWVNDQTLVGGDPVNPDYPITYTLVAYNRGPSDAWDVTITDTLPVTITNVITPGGWAVCEWTTHTLTCTAPHLPYEAWRRIVVEAIAPLVTGTITNTAWITVESSLALTATSRFSDTEVTTIWPLADLIIGKTAEPSPAYPGETITYTLTITNVGPSDVPTPVVVDEFLSGEQAYVPILPGWMCMTSTLSRIECAYSGTLAAGSSISLQITTTAPLTGVVDNRALAADWLGNTTDPDWDNNLVYLHTAVLPTADLVVTKTVVSDTVVAGAPLTYTITIRNAGPVDAGAAHHTLELQSLHGQDWQGRNRAVPYHSMIHVRGFEGRIENITVTLGYVDDPYPADLRLLLVGPNGQAVLLMANAGGGTDIEYLMLTLNDAGQLMPISDTLTSTVVYRPTNHGFGGDLPLPAPAGPYGSSLGAFVGSSPNGQWRLYVYNAVADAGGFLEYWTLTLTTRTTDTVTLKDILPAGLSDVRLTGRPADWDCAVSSQNVACEFDRLPVGAVTVITLTATAPITPGVITNTAIITSTTLDPITTTNTAWVTATVIPVADIQIVKTVMPTGRVGQGAPLTYTLTITNLGPGLAVAPIVVTDYLPIELTTVITGGAGWSCDLTALPVLTCTRSSDLSVNGVSVLTLRATAPLTSGLVLTNTAGVSGASFDPITANNTSLITLTVAPQANLGVIKMVEPALALPGDLLTYTVIVTNYGPSAAVYVTLTDRIQNATLSQPSGGTCMQAGNTFTCTIAALNPLSMTTIVVTATAPASNGLITNTAWVTSGIEDLQPGNNTYTSTLPVTQRPVANAGADQTLRPLATVTLNGSGSYDPDNNLPLAYGWTQTGGPAITLSSATAVSLTFTAPAVPAVITLSLRVTDSLGAPCLVPDVVVITVTNRPPVADAGADQAVYVAAPVMLNGGGSSDPDGDLPLTYSWTQTGGPAVILSSATVVSPTFTAPATPAMLTFTLRVTDSFGMPDPTPDEVVVTVGDRPIVGLQAFNDSPTFLGQTTHLWATVVTGTNITYQWAFGDGQIGSGISVTHVYAAEGWYTATVTAANGVGSITATTLISITEFPTMTIYLPIVMRNYASAPDLAVEQIAVTANSIQVVVRNVGDTPIDKTLANEFWVDVYINPNTPPATVNQTWRHVGSSGIVWGVTQDALPLAPGQAITLTVTPAGGLYYRADLSSVAWPLSAGARIYAQADSAHSATAYGAILENHEIIGAPYLNNIMGPTVLSATAPTRTRSSRR